MSVPLSFWLGSGIGGLKAQLSLGLGFSIYGGSNWVRPLSGSHRCRSLGSELIAHRFSSTSFLQIFSEGTGDAGGWEAVCDPHGPAWDRTTAIEARGHCCTPIWGRTTAIAAWGQCGPPQTGWPELVQGWLPGLSGLSLGANTGWGVECPHPWDKGPLHQPGGPLLTQRWVASSRPCLHGSRAG